ncbi:MAG TPA: amidophosphoribosyltransferase [Actinomycetota bacterium]|nr:amidophosphoribosyltransferase [Actinomycetota bacterium]
MDLESDKPRDACGVVAIYAPGEDVSRQAYFALFALQHRGQESAGISVSEGEKMVVVKDMGLVAQVFDEHTLNALQGHLGIGHVRYSTTGSSSWENAQPVYRESAGRAIALGHNGNLVNTLDLARELDSYAPTDRRATTDSDLIAELIVRTGLATREAILATLPKLSGAFTLVMMDEKSVFGARDPLGLRPLSLGRFDSGNYVMASETCALDLIGAQFVREVEPGELVEIGENGVQSHRYAPVNRRLCVFEHVYLARPDSVLHGKSVQKTRITAGRILAREAPVQADLVVPVPDSGRGAAAGFSQESGIAYAEGFVKSPYVGRTFIQPTQAIRQQGVAAKLNPISEVVSGKRLVVVDDSIVRGNTTRQIVHMLRRAGATEVHMRISSPPIKWPCFYGIDTGDQSELIASSNTVEEVRNHIGADSLSYLSPEGLLASTDDDPDSFCTACFTAEYPIPVPDEIRGRKLMLEA